jgi:hypothetical protein
MFKKSKYSKFYFSIIDNAKSRTISSNIYTEKHHIIPKSLGGDNSSLNLVKLTAREHFVCHRLLVRITIGQNRNKMVHALWRMCNSLKSDYKVNSKTYEAARLEHIYILKTVGSDGQFKVGRTTWNKGIPRTTAEKIRISKSRKGIKTGRTKDDFTEEWKSKISAAKKEQNNGKNNPMYGKRHSAESRLKMSATRKLKAGTPGYNLRPACSKETANKIKMANTGKRWVHNKVTKERKYIDPYLVTDYLNSGWELGLGSKS